MNRPKEYHKALNAFNKLLEDQLKRDRTNISVMSTDILQMLGFMEKLNFVDKDFLNKIAESRRVIMGDYPQDGSPKHQFYRDLIEIEILGQLPLVENDRIAKALELIEIHIEGINWFDDGDVQYDESKDFKYSTLKRIGNILKGLDDGKVEKSGVGDI